tara:strand:- start:271 stop:477 length:207 start_codon:yes stop_codon:yes gene_type:complete
MSESEHGTRPIQSAIVKISQDKVELFRSNGLAEASVGDSVSFLVKLDRRRKVVEADRTRAEYITITIT